MPESSRRPWSLWIAMLLILGAAATVPALMPRFSPPPPLPQPEEHVYPDEAVDLAPWLIARLPHVRVVHAPPTDNFYLADDSVPETVSAQDLDQLQRRPDAIEKWKGVVYVAQCFFDPRLYDRSNMGEFGFIAPPYMFFGDADLLAKIDGVMAGRR